ncbi:MAG TPA: helix-turn-helix domain-containing protein [Blastocatellia bacterium]|nr:helix-turn-helix domain-containing protein [Blastocatellia bacterium]
MTPEPTSLQTAIIRSLAESIEFPAIEDLLPAGQTLEDFVRRNLRRSLHIKHGELVFTRETGGPALIVLIKGAAEMFYPSRSAPLFSKRLALGHVLVDVGPFRGATLGGEAVAGEDCWIVVLSVSQTRELLGFNDEALPQWRSQACHRLAVFQCECLRAVHAAAKPARKTPRQSSSRLPSLLIEIAGADGVISGVTQGRIAEMLGLHRGSVTRSLSRLRRQGLIEVSRRKITLLQVEGLRELAGVAPGLKPTGIGAVSNAPAKSGRRESEGGKS